MNHRLASRLSAILLIGIFVGILIRRDNEKWRQLGREAYIDHQLADFNSNKTEPQPAALMIFASIILSALVFGLYELLVFLFSAIFKKLLPPPTIAQPPPAPTYHPFS